MKCDFQVGDKVSIRENGGTSRGLVVELRPMTAIVETSDGQRNELPYGALTNFSAAARKAWATRPHRRVGRPRGATVQRTTVNLRIDSDVWDAIRDAERDGLIVVRTATINEWLRVGLRRLRRSSK